jgi:hypothetical protein
MKGGEASSRSFRGGWRRRFKHLHERAESRQFAGTSNHGQPRRLKERFVMATKNGHGKGKTGVNRKREQKRGDRGMDTHKRRGGMRVSKAYQTDEHFVMVPIEHFQTIVGACGGHLLLIKMHHSSDEPERRQAAKSVWIVFEHIKAWRKKYPIVPQFETLNKMSEEVPRLSGKSRDARQETE